MKVTIDVDEQSFALLAVLDERGRPEAALRELVVRAEDGIRRPGSWERQWLYQAFGDEWTQQLEQDPEAWWRQRPRPRSVAAEREPGTSMKLAGDHENEEDDVPLAPKTSTCQK